MKIISKEQEIPIVFVQGKDILLLRKYQLKLPRLLNIQKINDTDKEKFYSFIEPDIISYLETQEDIVDYKQIIYLSKQSRGELIYHLLEQKEKIAKLLINQSIKTNQLLQECEILSNQVYDLFDIESLRYGKRFLSFPNITDYNTFSFVRPNYCYVIGYSLDPNRLLLTRVDGMSLTENEQIDEKFIQVGVSLAIQEKRSREELDFDFVVLKPFLQDHKYLVIDFVPKEVIMTKALTKELCKNILKQDDFQD